MECSRLVDPRVSARPETHYSGRGILSSAHSRNYFNELSKNSYSRKFRPAKYVLYGNTLYFTVPVLFVSFVVLCSFFFFLSPFNRVHVLLYSIWLFCESFALCIKFYIQKKKKKEQVNFSQKYSETKPLKKLDWNVTDEYILFEQVRCHRKSDPGLYRSGRIGSASEVNPSDHFY